MALAVLIFGEGFALDHLAIGLVDNKYTQLGKIGEKVFLILGLANINLPLW